MYAYTVYRVEYRTKKTVRIGKVVDRRKGERQNNAADMLRVAQRIYAKSSIDSHVFILRESSSLSLLFGDNTTSSSAAG